MNTAQNLYFRLGGEPVIREFVDNLYDFMDHFPAVEKVRKMHSEDLSQSRDRLFMFLSGILGGSPLYVDTFGHPYLRQKHMHLKVDDLERDQWLFCAQNAANQLDINAEVRDDLMSELTRMAEHLRNQGGVMSTQDGWQSDHQLH